MNDFSLHPHLSFLLLIDYVDLYSEAKYLTEIKRIYTPFNKETAPSLRFFGYCSSAYSIFLNNCSLGKVIKI